MIHPEMRVSEVLSRYPQLLDELIAASPAFAKLRNPLLRRTMPRLVSVAQAARIGGLEPDALLERLNRALGIDNPPAPAATQPAETRIGTPAPAWLEAPVGFQLDVRPILAAGGEPFQNIMQAAAEVLVGQRLLLEAPFEPLPLYKVMEKKGFAAWCEQLAPQHFRVHFYRLPSSAQPSRKVLLDESAWNQPAHATLRIEANWEPPLPMQRVLEALATLPPGQRLLVRHVRRPVHLLARLEQEGVPYLLRDLGPGRVDLLIEKPRY